MTEIPMGKEKTAEEILCPYCSKAWECPHLVAVIESSGEWYAGYAFEHYNELSGAVGDGDDVGNYNDLMVTLFQDAGAVQQHGVTHAGIPGYEATLSVFHAEDPKGVFEAVLSKFKESLEG
jgi:hypothetical protein